MLAWLYSLLWILMQLFVTAYESINWLCWRLHVDKFWSYDQSDSENEISYSERIVLERCKQQLGKVPRHLNIIVGPTDTQVDTVAFGRIVTYAQIVGIDCVSLFDVRDTESGKLSLSEMSASKEINLDKIQYKFQWRTIGDISNQETECNGNYSKECHRKTQKYVEIYEIRPKHNRPLVAAVCRKLFEHERKDKTQESLTQCIHENLLSRLYYMPDPDLSLIFNQDMCTFGLLPWHARFTEFHLHTPERCFDVMTFAQSLYKYARCEQRWGK